MHLVHWLFIHSGCLAARRQWVDEGYLPELQHEDSLWPLGSFFWVNGSSTVILAWLCWMGQGAREWCWIDSEGYDLHGWVEVGCVVWRGLQYFSVRYERASAAAAAAADAAAKPVSFQGVLFLDFTLSSLSTYSIVLANLKHRGNYFHSKTLHCHGHNINPAI